MLTFHGVMETILGLLVCCDGGIIHSDSVFQSFVLGHLVIIHNTKKLLISSMLATNYKCIDQQIKQKKYLFKCSIIIDQPRFCFKWFFKWEIIGIN